jgi:hypothetical protein
MPEARAAGQLRPSAPNDQLAAVILATRPRVWGLAMSRPDEPDPTNPNDLSYYAPRQLRERAKSVSLSQEARSEPARSPISYRPSPDVRLKTPVYLRHPPAPEVIHGPAGPEHEQRRAALFGVAGRFAAVAAFVMVVALLFVVISPALRQSGASSTPSEITGSIRTALPQSSQDQNEAKPALAEFQGVLASIPTSKPATPEQPPQLLQQFLQWRQKANSTETPQ